MDARPLFFGLGIALLVLALFFLVEVEHFFIHLVRVDDGDLDHALLKALIKPEIGVGERKSNGL